MNTVDIDFNWGLGETGRPEENALSQDSSDCEATRPMVILRLAEEPLYDTSEKRGVNPYNTGRFEIERKWPPHARK